MTARYARPPIVEAVIEARLTAPMDLASFEKLRKSATPRFQNALEEVALEFNFVAGAAPPSNAVRSLGVSGVRFDRSDATQIMVLKRESLAVSCHAPYPGWDTLVEFAREEWRRLEKVIGSHKTFARLGVRYINRLDVPEEADGSTDAAHYVTFSAPRNGLLSGPAEGFSCAVGGVEVGDYRLNLTVASVPSPLLKHLAFVIDIDTFRNATLKFADLEPTLSGMRSIKNDAFEGIITDAARDLLR